MNGYDPNVAKVKLIAQALGNLRDELVFVGGCAAGLLMTDAAGTTARITYDVDLVAEVTALSGYHKMESEFSRLGFKQDVSPDAPICRWRYRDLEVDLMPTDASILGFANRWYPMVVATATRVELSEKVTIRLITAPLFVATKFEAFADRGKQDILASHDLEDIINLVDGRPGLVSEIAGSASDLRSYLAAKCQTLLDAPGFMNYLPGMVAQDQTMPQRVATVAERLRQIATIAT